MFGLFNRVSLEFAGTCCAQRTARFSTAVPLREEGGWTGTTKCFLFFFSVNGGLVCAHLCSSVVTLSGEYSGGDRLSSFRALSCRKCTSKNVSQLRRCLVTLLLKANPFLAIIPGFLNAEAGRGGYFTTAMIEIYK